MNIILHTQQKKKERGGGRSKLINKETNLKLTESY